MQLANIMLSLSGDAGQTIPKSAITPSELAILQLIHGETSVADIDPYGQVNRTSRAERERLLSVYGKNEDGVLRSKAIDSLFPGVAARMFETFDELELPEEFYKPAARVGAGTTAASRNASAAEGETVLSKEEVLPLDAPVKRGKKKAVEPDPPPVIEDALAAAADEDDGIGDMAPAGDDMFK